MPIDPSLMEYLKTAIVEPMQTRFNELAEDVKRLEEKVEMLSKDVGGIVLTLHDQAASIKANDKGITANANEIDKLDKSIQALPCIDHLTKLTELGGTTKQSEKNWGLLIGAVVGIIVTLINGVIGITVVQQLQGVLSAIKTVAGGGP